MQHIELTAQLVLLLVIANATPVAVSLLLGRHLGFPLDGHLDFIDQRPLFGPSKTLRGLVAAILVSALVAPLFGLTFAQGALFGSLAMLGDLITSFIKRRLGMAPSKSVPGFDQLLETLLPLWVMQPVFGASGVEIAAAIAAFVVIDLLFSWVKNRIRKKVRSEK